jgi:hypothetical protein
MRTLFLIATLSLTTFALAQPAAAPHSAVSDDANSFDQILATHIKLYRAAWTAAAPGPCETQHVEFVRIGEYLKASNVAVPAAGESLYSRTLTAQANQYQSIWHTIAPSNTPAVGNSVQALPGSMASNAASGASDFYSLTMAAQVNLNQRMEAAYRL